MRKLFHTAIVLTLTASSSYAQDAALGHLRRVIAANSLVEPGNPFHVQMSFQYYDLKGKPVDAGMLEEWWTSPDTYLITIAAPSVNHGVATPLDDSTKIDLREGYILLQLLDAETHPVPGFDIESNKPIIEAEKPTGATMLTCFSLDKADSVYCADPKSDAVSLQTQSRLGVTMRSTPDTFDKVNIAHDIAIAYGGHPTISGHLRTIEAFDSSTSTLSIPHQSLIADLHGPTKGVVHGKLLKSFPLTLFNPLTTPVGYQKVFVSFRINTDGSTSRVFALSSSSSVVAEAAVDAVRKYKFEPYLMAGKPIEGAALVAINSYLP